MTDIENLLSALYKKYPTSPFKTSDLFKLDRFIPVNRLDRNGRLLREKGFLRRLTEEEKKRAWILSKEDAYQITELGIQEAKTYGQQELFK